MQSPDTSATAVRELWSVGDFARAHGISSRQVYILMERGDLDGVRIGRRTLVTNCSRLRWLSHLPRKEPSPLNCGAQVAA